MPVKSETQFAILAMLAIRPMSAYDLVKFAENSIVFFWNESYGNIHKHLQKMEKDGYVRILEQENQGRQKIIYSIVEKGRNYLSAWIIQDPGNSIMRDALLLKIFSAQPGQFPQLQEILKKELYDMQQAQMAFSQIKRMISALDQDSNLKEMWLLTIRYGEQYAETRQAWCREAINTLSDLARK
jgi:PadR family transcriptional regulator, regulatory protein AphA